MKKNNPVVFILVTVASLCYAYGFKTHEFKDLGFSIDCPTNWEVSKFSESMISILLPMGAAKTKCKPNIVINTGLNENPQIDLETFVNDILEKIPTYPSSSLLLSEKIKLDNIEAHKFVYNRAMSNVLLRDLEVCIVTPHRAYVIIYQAADKDFDNYIKVVNEVINSFKLLGPKDQIVKQRIYKSPYFNFTVSYPAHCYVQEVDKNVFFAFKPNSISKDTANVVISVEDITENPVTLKQYEDLSIPQIPTTLANFKLLKREEAEIGGWKASLKIFTGQRHNTNFKFEQYTLIASSNVFVLTYTANEKAFDSYLPSAESIMKSFKVTK